VLFCQIVVICPLLSAAVSCGNELSIDGKLRATSRKAFVFLKRKKQKITFIFRVFSIMCSSVRKRTVLYPFFSYHFIQVYIQIN